MDSAVKKATVLAELLEIPVLKILTVRIADTKYITY